MRAAIVRDKQFVVENIPTPAPGPGQVLAKVHACGICGSDVHLFNHAKELLETFKGVTMGQEAENQDLIMGHEFVAEIVAFGPDTRQALAIGERVCSIPFLQQGEELLNIGVTPEAKGAYAEYLLLTEDLLVPVPANLSNDAAALVEPLAVGVHAVAKADIRGEVCALVIGCGPIGLATIAALKLQGVERVLASDYSARRRELATTMGASLVIDPAEHNPCQLLAEEGTESHLVFECAGRQGLISQIIEQAPSHTRIVVVGVCPGEDSFTPLAAMMKEIQMQFAIYYTPEEFATALQALADGRVDWHHWVSSKVDLNGVASAFMALKNPEQETKILIEPWS